MRTQAVDRQRDDHEDQTLPDLGQPTEARKPVRVCR